MTRPKQTSHKPLTASRLRRQSGRLVIGSSRVQSSSDVRVKVSWNETLNQATDGELMGAALLL